MKQVVYLLWLLAVCSQSSSAQYSQQHTPIVLKARVWTPDAQLRIGYLFAITDTSLLLSPEKKLVQLYDSSGGMIQRFGYKELQKVVLYRRPVGRPVLMGFILGATVGAVIGFASGDDPRDQLIAFTAGEKALVLGFFGGTMGSLVGLVAGLAGRKTFNIYGKKERFERMRIKTMRRLGF